MAAVAPGLDIRVKLAVAVLCTVAGMAGTGPAGHAAPALAALPLLLFLRQWAVLLAMALLMPTFYAGFAGLAALQGATGLGGPAAVAANIAAYALYFLLKLTPLAAVFAATCRSSRLGEVLAALSQARLPRAAVLAVAVTFRFIPTLMEEYGHIRDALALRDSRGWLAQGPLRRTERLLLPLLVRSARLADELSISALTRGIEAPEALPARLPRPGARDILALAWALAVACAMLWAAISLRKTA